MGELARDRRRPPITSSSGWTCSAGPGYPFCLELRAGYRLSADAGLEVTVTARNSGSRAAPFGTGDASVLRGQRPGMVDECELELPAARWQPADDRGIPAGDAAGRDRL